MDKKWIEKIPILQDQLSAICTLFVLTPVEKLFVEIPRCPKKITFLIFELSLSLPLHSRQIQTGRF